MMHDVHLRGWRAVWCGVLAAFLLACWAAPQSARAAASCRSVQVPVTVAKLSNASLYGELCVPAGRSPRTVQMLVPGSTYTHAYWDWPQNPGRYSYVRKALDAGYATFNVDRLGSGRSTHPPSALVTLDASLSALHQVIAQLRTGAIGGHAFTRVVWVGHSLGSIYGWLDAATYPGDVDAFVLTGMLHSIKPSYLMQDNSYPAPEDPKFADAGLDPGYLTTRPERRGDLFYFAAGSDPAVIALDEQLKDVVAVPELTEALAYMDSPPPDTAPSRTITVPTLLVLGDHDPVVCGPPDGLDCTIADVMAQEAPYYRPQARLEVQVTANTGHDLPLHLTAARSTGRILDWVGRHQR